MLNQLSLPCGWIYFFNNMKNSYYFPHDYHARHDPKLEKLRMEYGAVTDGIFWDLVEMLYEEDGYLNIKDIPLFSKMFNTSEEIIKKVIENVFIIENDRFFNKSLLERLNKIKETREERTIASNKRWISKCNANAYPNAMQLQSNIKESKESKVNKESKDNNIVHFDFQSIWIKYPKKIGSKQAERHFLASVKTEQDYKDIQTALNNYLESDNVKRGFVQNGSTWLNNWRDWIENPVKGVDDGIPDSLRPYFKKE